MSMISAQCDQLRERAKELCSLAPDPAVPYLVPSTKETMALAMRSAASEMEDAADTIWELRCKLADMVDMRERARVAEAENEKLRELATLNWKWAHSCCGNNCKMQTGGCGYGIDRECNYERDIYDRMRELGIEVDG